MSQRPLQIATVPYCNAYPLTHFLKDELPDAVLVEVYPSAMRERLLDGDIDLALMPVAELLRTPNAKIISDCAIACNGEVRSVRIWSKKPIHEIKTLSLDAASRSSVTMSDLMLRHFFNIEPVKVQLPLGEPLNSCRSDAFVVIGDRCLSHQPSGEWAFCYDLGALWKSHTSLPFVFAAWIGINDRAMDANLVAALRHSRDRGLAELETVVNAADSLPIERGAVLDYYRNAIGYTIGEPEKGGLRKFLALAYQYGYCGTKPEVRFVV